VPGVSTFSCRTHSKVLRTHASLLVREQYEFDPTAARNNRLVETLITNVETRDTGRMPVPQRARRRATSEGSPFTSVSRTRRNSIL
jgi:hypothetical protein